MNETSSTTEPRPVRAPSSIAARERAIRQSHRQARVLVLIVLLHGVYFLVPLLPSAQTRALLPWLLWLPPLFAVTILVSGFRALHRWTQQRRQASQFVPLPPVEEVS
jgi:fatty acid desaturase